MKRCLVRIKVQGEVAFLTDSDSITDAKDEGENLFNNEILHKLTGSLQDIGHSIEITEIPAGQ